MPKYSILSSQAPREAYIEAYEQVMWRSFGKASAVMLRLTEKTFYPSKLPWLAKCLNQAENEEFESDWQSKLQTSDKEPV